jgi:hypothetical protein
MVLHDDTARLPNDKQGPVRTVSVEHLTGGCARHHGDGHGAGGDVSGRCLEGVDVFGERLSVDHDLRRRIVGAKQRHQPQQVGRADGTVAVGVGVVGRNNDLSGRQRDGTQKKHEQVDSVHAFKFGMFLLSANGLRCGFVSVAASISWSFKASRTPEPDSGRFLFPAKTILQAGRRA